MTSTWWQPLSDVVPSWFATFLTLERTTSGLWTRETQFVPGLFQTSDYARAVIGLEHPDPADRDRRVELRQGRQALLDRATPPVIRAVIAESALTGIALSTAHRQAQLGRLIELTERPNVTIVIVSDRVDGPRMPDPSFTVLRFDDPAEADLVYIELQDGARYLREPDEVGRYVDFVEELTAGTSADHTRDILHRLRAVA